MNVRFSRRRNGDFEVFCVFIEGFFYDCFFIEFFVLEEWGKEVC